MSWYAAGYCHKPLYFEDSNLERYGQSRGWLADPFVSAALLRLASGIAV